MLTCIFAVEGTLNNGYSSVDISLISPHKINVPTSFSYTDGAGGKSCASGNCPCNNAAFCQPTDYGALINTADPNAVSFSLFITYLGDHITDSFSCQSITVTYC